MSFRLSIANDRFERAGKPHRIVGGSIHYPRVHPSSWRDRIQKLIDFGCNTLETYTFWNAHEPYPNQFRFDGILDVVKFVELAGSMGLDVIVRPGPYVCAEWDMGGLPWWLINEPGIQIRTSDPKYTSLVGRYFDQLIPKLAPLQSTNGGPIVAMQIENEYGYFGNDAAYLAWLRDRVRSYGVDVLLFTSDGTYQRNTIKNGGLPDLLRTANYGSGAIERFKVLREFQPTGPLMCSEFWVGWFDEWKQSKHNGRSAEETAREYAALLDTGASSVIYMFIGGTNFGFSAGGNHSDKFKCFVTSYDYDALLSEAGDITPKYRACRDALRKHFNITAPPRDNPDSPKRAYGTIRLTESAALDGCLDQLARPIVTPMPRTMEQLGHGTGFVHYSGFIDPIFNKQKLVIRGMHDWAVVLIDGRRVACWSRHDPQPDITLSIPGDRPAKVEILVHNLGRSNFGHRTMEPRGITEGVFVGPERHEERAVIGWTQHALPLLEAPALNYATSANQPGPSFLRGTLQVDTPADTFLRPDDGFDLGVVFVNGFNLGRFWNVGPQRTLYLPAGLLKPGANEVILFDASGTGAMTIESVNQPVLG